MVGKPASLGLPVLLRSTVFCAIGVGLLVGAALACVGLLASSMGWLAHELLEMFATGFAIGFVATLAGVTSDYDGRCKLPTSVHGRSGKE